MLKRRSELLEQLRQLGKLRLAGAARDVALALEAVEAVDDMHGVVGAALLAVVDDVDAGGLLPRNDISHRGVDSGVQFGAAPLAGQQLFRHRDRARQAASVSGECSRSTPQHAPLRCFAGPFVSGKLPTLPREDS